MVTKSLALGTANFSNGYRLTSGEPFSAQDVLIAAFESGIDCLDVSDAYEGAYQEIGRSGIRWKLNAKMVLSGHPSSYLKEVNQKVKDLLQAVPRAQINCLMIHNSTNLSKKSLENALDVMRVVGERFGVSNTGLSLYPDDEDKIMINGSNTIQIPISILDQRICSSSIFRDKRMKSTKIQARSIFLRGLISSFDTPQSFIKDEDLSDLKLFHKWCKFNEVDPIFACINFVYHLNFIDTIVLGINSKKELLINLKAIDESRRHRIKTDFKSFKSANLELIDPRRWKV